MTDTVPHTLAGFTTSFEVAHGRPPTSQEIFSAGVRAGRDLRQRELKSVFDSSTNHYDRSLMMREAFEDSQ